MAVMNSFFRSRGYTEEDLECYEEEYEGELKEIILARETEAKRQANKPKVVTETKTVHVYHKTAREKANHQGGHWRTGGYTSDGKEKLYSVFGGVFCTLVDD